MHISLHLVRKTIKVKIPQNVYAQMSISSLDFMPHFDFCFRYEFKGLFDFLSSKVCLIDFLLPYL